MKELIMVLICIVTVVLMLITVKHEKDKEKQKLNEIKHLTKKAEKELLQEIKLVQPQHPKNNKVVKITTIANVLSTFIYFILVFFPYGKIAGENTPKILDFVFSYFGKPLSDYNQFLIPVKSIASIVTVSGVCMLLFAIIRLIHFLKAKSQEEILGFYSLGIRCNLLAIIYTIFLIPSLIFYNDIATNDFLIDSNFIYLSIGSISVYLIFSIIDQFALKKYYYKYYKETMRLLPIKSRKKGFFLDLLIVLLFFAALVPISIAPVKNIYSDGFKSKLYPNFPTQNHFSVYDADFDKEPDFIFTPENESHNISGEHTLICYSNNYCYYMARLEALEKEITSSWSLEEIHQKEELKTRLNDNLKKLEYGYMYLDYTIINIKVPNTNGYTRTTKVNEIIYDASRGSDPQKKWGSDKSLRNFAFKEKIDLQKKSFEEGTNFSNINLGVKIYYNDGSMHLYYVNPSNAAQLNEAGKGTHSFEWSDEWGSYSIDITIY